jgi:AhpD family alkylhydroperoxidase
MGKFNRRTYRRVGDFFRDLGALWKQRDRIGPLMRGETIERAFRERLFLTVTAVNGCRYCSYVHARQALQEGIDREQVQALCQGALEGCPADELPALLYAQHWSESDARPEGGVREKVAQIYGVERLSDIELGLRVIRVANLLGNLADLLLYRLSLGRWNPQAPVRMGGRLE